MQQFDPSMFVWLLPLLILLAIWDVAWKGVGLWKSSKNNQLGWFVAILIVNSVGILPILYILYFQKKEEVSAKDTL